MLDYSEAARAERDALDLVSTGIITFDSGKRVLFANAAARTRGEELSLRVNAGSDLSGPPSVVNGIRALLANTLRGGAGGTCRLSQPNGREIGITVTSVRGRAFDHASHHRTASPAAIALLVDISRNGEAASALLAARHGLTAAELRVATALSQTSGMKAAAAMLGISSNTLKSHTKRIYAKIGVRGHAELVQSIAHIAQVLDPSM
jgi:DNA-binding CsgD family transcriptional regulator